eukprot:353182-Chlamydomonas_euryale.AAC.63
MSVMDDTEAKFGLMLARQLAQRVHVSYHGNNHHGPTAHNNAPGLAVTALAYEYVRKKEDEHKQRDRFNRYPQRLGAAEAVSAVLQGTQLNPFTAENLVKELGRSGEDLGTLHARGHAHAHVRCCMVNCYDVGAINQLMHHYTHAFFIV